MEKQNYNITLIKKLLKNEHLSPSTRTFVASLLSWAHEKPLTRRQQSALRRIEYNYFGKPYKTQEYESWIDGWNEEKREILMVCAKYYIENPPYFSELCHRIISDKSFVPTEEQYRRITENRYAEKVLQSYYSDPAFAAGQLVCRRKSITIEGCPSTQLPMTVIEVNVEPIVSAAKGGKRYRLLPLGKTRSIVMEERHLKKFHKIKKTT
jgi:hypothetical protein